jgi:hypothetical protein
MSRSKYRDKHPGKEWWGKRPLAHYPVSWRSKTNKFFKRLLHTMNKEFSYKNYNFNIKVELDVKIERRFNGKRFHKVIINDMGVTNYIYSETVESDKLTDTIDEMVSKTKLWVDSREGGSDTIVSVLKDMGFN